MKQLKRLDVTPHHAYDRATKSPLRQVALSREAFEALQRERPKLIAEAEGNVLIAQPAQGIIALQYGFANSDAFARHFPALFEKLLPALTLDDAPMGIRLRHTDAASRPFVQPVLFAHAFEVVRDWLRMELSVLPDGGPGNAAADGFVLREARGGDAEAIVELDAVAFPQSWLTPDIVRQSVEQGPVFRVLEDTASGRAVGFLRLRHEGPVTGYISDVALHPDYQGRGLGEATMRWALRHFRNNGMRDAALTVNSDNNVAIALYRKLGFSASGAGIDYRRPLDEDEVRQVLEKNRASHITVRRRY